MELRQYSAVVWRWKWLLLVCILLAALAAFIVSSSAPQVYEASTTVLINEAPDSQTSDYTAILTSERLARTYARLLTTRPVLEETLGRVESGMKLDELESAISVQLIPDTQLIELRVESPKPVLAAVLANTLVAVFAEQNADLQANRFAASKTSLGTQLDRIGDQILATESALAELPDIRSEAQEAENARLLSELSQNQANYTDLLQSYEALRIAEAGSISNIIQVEPAQPPENPINPNTLLYTTLAGAVGAMMALGAAFLIEYLDETIRSAEDVARVTELPIIGFVSDARELKAGGTRQEMLISQPNSEMAESFRSLRTNLELLGTQGTPRSILVTSPEPSDGKTSIAAQLAVSMAQGGKKVVLIDANLRQPSLHSYFGIENELGLSDMLVDDLVPQIVAQQSVHWRLRIITGGKPVDNPAELIGSVWLLKALARLREQADVAIFDGAPFFVAESSIIASKIESTLIVIRYGRTGQTALRQIMEHQGRVQANLSGIVMNRAPDRLAHSPFSRLAYGYSKNSTVSNPAKVQPGKAKGQVVLRNGLGETSPFVEETEGGTEVHS